MSLFDSQTTSRPSKVSILSTSVVRSVHVAIHPIFFTRRTQVGCGETSKNDGERDQGDPHLPTEYVPPAPPRYVPSLGKNQDATGCIHIGLRSTCCLLRQLPSWIIRTCKPAAQRSGGGLRSAGSPDGSPCQSSSESSPAPPISLLHSPPGLQGASISWRPSCSSRKALKRAEGTPHDMCPFLSSFVPAYCTFLY